MRVHGKTNIHQIDCIKNPCSLPTILQNNTLDNKLVKYPRQGCINQGARVPHHQLFESTKSHQKCCFCILNNVTVNTNLTSKVLFVNSQTYLRMCFDTS